MNRSLIISALLLGVAACGGTSTVDSHVTTSGGSGSTGHTTSTSGAGTNGNGTTSSGTNTTTTGGTTGGCAVDGRVVGVGNDAQCCSNLADSSGVCVEPSGTAGSGTTSASGTTSNGTGTTVGGTCPQNMPDINGGVGYVVDGGSCSELGCPNGFDCENGICVLHGANGGLQFTLSFDDPEDLDIHVAQPDACTVWYENRQCSGGGSLDRDSNAGCFAGSQGDGVNIENVIYSGNTYPLGQYGVFVDYYQDCNNASSSNYGIQVRANGALWTYCGSISGADFCSSAICGHQVATINVTQ
ncbi:MAG: hypothetical protein JST54_14475 [Deltaproteobacteria bacterium]|nr:hypothetical protein [Deltaproteobacteria bacterium]